MPTCSCRKPNTTDRIRSAITLPFVGVVSVAATAASAAAGFIFQILDSIDLDLKQPQT